MVRVESRRKLFSVQMRGVLCLPRSAGTATPANPATATTSGTRGVHAHSAFGHRL